MQVQSSKTSGSQNQVSGFLRLFVLSLLTAAFACTSLHAQTVAYVAISGVTGGNNLVSVIDTSTNTVTANITVGLGPQGVVFAPDGTRAFVLNATDSTISVIDTASNTVTATIPLGGSSSGGNSEQLAITPDGKTLYSPDTFTNQVFVVSTQTNSVVAAIPVPAPSAVAITPDGSRAYVAESPFAPAQVAVINTTTNTVITSIAVPSLLPQSIAITPSGANVYVAGGLNANVSVIATSNNTLAATIPLPGGAFGGIAFSPDGSKAYISDDLTNNVDVIDTNTNTVEPGSISIPEGPLFLAVTPDGASLYVTNFGDAASVVSTATNTVVATVPLVDQQAGIAISNRNAPFASFPAPTPGSPTNPNKISLSGSLSLGANSPGLDFAHQPMTLTVGGFSLLFPAGTVTQVGNGAQQHFTFGGTLNGLSVTFDLIGNSPNFSYSVTIQGKNVKTQVGPNPVTVSLAIGSNSGSSTVNF